MLVKCPKCGAHLSVLEPQADRIVEKQPNLSGLGIVGDCTSYTNLSSEEEKQRDIRDFLSQHLNRPMAQSDGYTNLDSLENNRHINPQRAAMMEAQRKNGFV